MSGVLLQREAEALEHRAASPTISKKGTDHYRKRGLSDG